MSPGSTSVHPQRALGRRTPNPTLRSTLAEATIDSATEATIARALARYESDREPPMIGFVESIDGGAIDCERCVICRMLDAEYGPPERVPLPDGSVLEIRRHRSN